MNQWKKIVAIGAHPDDIEINCGGTLAKFIQKGSKVTLIVAGSGEFANANGLAMRTQKQAIKESKNAIKIMGLKERNLINLGFEDKKISHCPELIERIEKILDAEKPDIIMTHWLHDTHQDHINVAMSVISAARYFNHIIMWEPLYPSGRNSINVFNPNFYVDITEVSRQKQKIIKCYQTQIKRRKNGPSRLDGVINRAKFRGFEVGCEFAEAFCVFRYKI